jgi:hypothetical protein
MNEFDLEEETNDEFDLEEKKSSNEITKDAVSSEPLLPAEVKGTITGAAIGSIPGVTSEIAGVIAENVAKSRSPYTPEQLATLSENYQQLKTIDPTETMKKVGEQFSQQNRIINEIEKQAYENLAEPIGREEYKKAIVRSSMPFTREVDTTTPEFLKKQEELIPRLQTINPDKKQEAEQLEKFASKKASDIINNKRSASLGTIPEEQLLQEYTNLKQQIKQNKEGFVFKPDMEKALKELQEQEVKNIELEDIGKQRAIEKFQTPLAKQFPELKGRLFSSAYAGVENDVAKILNRYKPGEKLRGEDAYKLVRDIREAVFSQDGKLKLGNDAAKAAQRAVRDLVGEKNPEASQLFEQMSQKISELKKLESTGYLKRDKGISKQSEDFIKFGQPQQQKIIQDIAPNLYKSKIDVSGDVADRLAELKKALPENLYKELELAVLKIAMDDPAKKATLSNFDLALATVAPQFAGSKYLGKLISSPAGSLQTLRIGKGLQKIAKPIGAIGAVAGGILGGPLGAFAGEVAQESLDVEPSGATPDMPEYWQELGVKSPEEQRIRSELSAFQEKYGAQPKTIQQKYPTNLALEGMSDIVEAPEITEQREILKKRKEDILKYNQEVEKVKKAGALAPTYVEAPKAKVLKADNPAEIAGIAKALQSNADKASQEYGRVLSQIVDAPMREKESILFGLNQQPAFRELVRKLKGQTEE